VTALPVTLASKLGDGESEPTWLIEGLWSESAVDVLGGEPKCCKSFLALDAAVSVASGRPCLRTFAVHRTGPVLVFPAEDPHAVVRRRLEGIAVAAGVELRDLPVHVITAPRPQRDARGRILDASPAAVPSNELRASCRMRAQTFWRALRELVDADRVERTSDER